MKVQFNTKDGQLSAYSFACGYIQNVWKNDVKIELYQDGCYHVRGYDFVNNHRLFWLTFDSLKEARKVFFQKTKSIHRYTKKETLKIIGA